MALEQVSAKYTCSNDAEIDYETKEITVGDSKTIKGLPIGVCHADESSVFERISADLIIDAAEISLVNSSAVDVALLSDAYSITLTGGEGENAIIKVGDSSLEIEKNTCEKIGSLEVMLVNVGTTSDGNRTADLLVGIKKLSLSNKENEIVEVADVENNEINDTNVTEQNFTTNETDFDINETINETINNNSSAEMNQTASEVKKDIGESCSLGDECLTGFCDDSICAKKGFFAKIVDWFKRLFS